MLSAAGWQPAVCFGGVKTSSESCRLPRSSAELNEAAALQCTVSTLWPSELAASADLAGPPACLRLLFAGLVCLSAPTEAESPVSKSRFSDSASYLRAADS